MSSSGRESRVVYFPLVFGAGFVLGTIRVLWIVPALGSRAAELLEMPVMFSVIILAARWVTRHVEIPSGSGTLPAPYKARWLTPWLGVGGMAVALILALDFTVVLWVRGLTFRQYIEAFDPMAGTA